MDLSFADVVTCIDLGLNKGRVGDALTLKNSIIGLCLIKIILLIIGQDSGHQAFASHRLEKFGEILRYVLCLVLVRNQQQAFCHGLVLLHM
jgi:hypothetical protein